MAKKRIRVTAALIERSGCFLVALRPLGGKRGGLWEFPGGKIRPGETPEACLKREIMEELGIGIKVLGFFDSQRLEDGDREIELLAFRALWTEGKLFPREHAALRWIEPSRFVEIDWSPPDLALADRLREEADRLD
jgi:8-oxo-dGTP diphosphatase